MSNPKPNSPNCPGEVLGLVARPKALRYCPAELPSVGHFGGVAERLKAHAWRACMGATPSRVRIPLPPPNPCPRPHTEVDKTGRKTRNIAAFLSTHVHA